MNCFFISVEKWGLKINNSSFAFANRLRADCDLLSFNDYPQIIQLLQTAATVLQTVSLRSTPPKASFGPLPLTWPRVTTGLQGSSALFFRLLYDLRIVLIERYKNPPATNGRILFCVLPCTERRADAPNNGERLASQVFNPGHSERSAR